ncbi:MAG: hypothetical protein U1F59_09805 [Candidatus Competibacteraceae bacterium]
MSDPAPAYNLDGERLPLPSQPVPPLRNYRADSIARIRTRIAGPELDALPDVFLIVIEHALDRAMSEVRRYAGNPRTPLFSTPHPVLPEHFHD